MMLDVASALAEVGGVATSVRGLAPLPLLLLTSSVCLSAGCHNKTVPLRYSEGRAL